MNLRKILFATDFSDASDTALRFATALARDNQASLLIVHCSEPRPAYTVAGIYASLPAGNEFADAHEQLARVTPTDSNIPFKQRLLIGPAAEEIVKFASEQAIDLIVIGSHGRTGLSRLLLGSVAEAIVRQATCPVVTVKPSAHLPLGT